MKNKTIGIVLLVFFVLFGLIQAIPVERSNPPVTADIKASPEVHSIFKRACYDCHSNETKWPWYSKVAPISILIAKDVTEGREYLNFSIWGDISEEGRANMKQTIWEKVSKGEMPLPQYKIAHPEARLSENDRLVIKKWSEDR